MDERLWDNGREMTAISLTPGVLAEAVVDLGAITHNVRVLREHAGDAQVMAVVKADGYGHGALRVARAALAGGAAELGVATIDEALALRADGIAARPRPGRPAQVSPPTNWLACAISGPRKRRPMVSNCSGAPVVKKVYVGSPSARMRSRSASVR